jgi:hypothetical protein
MRYKHGLSKKPEYWVWVAMIRRCRYPPHPVYPHYGGRGITVCEAWSDVKTFYSDMGPRPTPKHWLERIDNDGNYEPGNCKWATIEEQCQNKRTTTPITYQGRTMTLQAWARQPNVHVNVNTLRYRIQTKGLTLEQALACPKYQRRRSLLP